MTLIHIHSRGHYPAYYIDVSDELLAEIREATKDGWTLSETEEGRALTTEKIHPLRKEQSEGGQLGAPGPEQFCEYS